MIQRVQSIFMLTALISMATMLFFPVWEQSYTNTKKGNNQREYAIMDTFTLRYEWINIKNGERKLLRTKDVLPISIGALLSSIIMLISVFQYKNRMRQIKLNTLFSLIVGCIIVGIVFYTTKGNLFFDTQLQGNYLIGFYLPVLALLNNFLANRYIHKDEKLVQSANRIR